MRSRFGMILTITMVAFAAVISIVISIFDHKQLREQAINNNFNQVRQNEVMARFALESMEKAFYEFGNYITSEMEKNSYYLLDLYEQKPSFEEWDFEALKQSLSSDIYIINDQNVIVYSSFEGDIGLDFKECCRKLAQSLDERRSLGGFFHDGIDKEQKTGKLKKYSYIATNDKKYLVQLGYYLEEDRIFNSFNFIEAINEFVKSTPSINEINVLNTGGYILGGPGANQELPEERFEFFDHTLQTGETSEYKGEWGGKPAVYRYVQYNSKYDDGLTQTKVVEIIYNENDLKAILSETRKTFVIQLVLILLSAVVISFILMKWVAKPLHLAFHDSLTGLKNRAALDELFGKAIAKNKGTTALMMIDLDNFKWVNDKFGHHTGDYLLKNVARCIRSVAQKEDIAIRLGGDEFVLVMPSTSKEESEQTARRLIASMEEMTKELQFRGEQISASIGIAVYPEHGHDQETLLKKADAALYASKEKGKNQYHVCL